MLCTFFFNLNCLSLVVIFFVQVVTFSGHTNNVTAVGFQKEGKWMYTGSEDGTVKIWDIK
jgi:WD40 repeat protein